MIRGYRRNYEVRWKQQRGVRALFDGAEEWKKNLSSLEKRIASE